MAADTSPLRAYLTTWSGMPRISPGVTTVNITLRPPSDCYAAGPAFWAFAKQYEAWFSVERATIAGSEEYFRMIGELGTKLGGLRMPEGLDLAAERDKLVLLIEKARGADAALAEKRPKQPPNCLPSHHQIRGAYTRADAVERKACYAAVDQLSQFVESRSRLAKQLLGILEKPGSTEAGVLALLTNPFVRQAFGIVAVAAILVGALRLVSADQRSAA